MKDKVVAIIVTYNPDKSLGKLISNIAEQVDRIVIVDNESSNKDFLKDIDTAQTTIIENNTNVGLATALNVGCQYCCTNGYEYTILLDQDSELGANCVKYLLNTMKSFDSECGIVSPRIFLKMGNEVKESNYLVKTKHGFKKENVKDAPLPVLINITSGSLVNLSIWNKVGGFWDGLFIEGIDDEYALRLNSAGYTVCIDNNARLIQQYGNQIHIRKFGLNWYPTYHKPIRRAYVYRNKILIMKRYFFKQNEYVRFEILSLIKKFVTIMLVEDNRCEKFKAIHRGCVYGFKGKKGEIR